MNTVTLEDAVEATRAFVTDDSASDVCGFLEFVGEGNGYGYCKVRATGSGVFQWVFSRGGTVISVTECINTVEGQEWEASVPSDVQIGISCGCQ